MQTRLNVYKENTEIINTRPELVKIPIKVKVYNLIKLAPIDCKRDGTIVCEPCTVNDAILKYSDANTFTLNFASDSNVGGGYTKGSMAQEEELCRTCIGLFPSLCTDEAIFWSWSDDINLSTDLLMYRHDATRDYAVLKDEVYTSIISASAPNMKRGNVINRYKDNPKLFFEKLENLVKGILLMAITNKEKLGNGKKNVLILGAFGCGVYAYTETINGKAYNRVMADVFAKVMMGHKDIVKMYDVICFAIPKSDRHDNYEVFESVITKL